MYEEIYKAWKNELENPPLQALPRDFYVRASEYVRRILEEKNNLDEKSLKFRLITEEYDNVKKLINDVSGQRLRKLINQVSQGKVIPEGTLTGEEETFFEKINNAVTSSAKLAKDVVEGQMSPTETVKADIRPKRILVRFMRDIPAIIGVDMEPYGPFKAEDVATLPLENVENLIKQGAAVKLEVEDR